MMPQLTVSEPNTDPPRSRPAGRSALVVDDDPLNRQLTQRILEIRGWSVAAVADGAEALDRVAGERFDLVLLDVEMPGLGGPDVAARIRERETGEGTTMKLVALTAHRRPAERRRCLAAGMDGYLTKPFDPVALDRLLAGADEPPAGEDSASAGSAGGVDWRRALVSAGNDRELLERLAVSAGNEVREQLDLLRAALETPAPERARHAAHRIRGALRIFGPRRARALAAELEARAGGGLGGGEAELLTQLSEELEVVLAELANGPPAALATEEE